MAHRARFSSDDRDWRQNRHDHHQDRARTRTCGRVSSQPSAHSPRLCRPPEPRAEIPLDLAGSWPATPSCTTRRRTAAHTVGSSLTGPPAARTLPAAPTTVTRSTARAVRGGDQARRHVLVHLDAAPSYWPCLTARSPPATTQARSHRVQAPAIPRQTSSPKGKIALSDLRRLRSTLAGCDRDWDNRGQTGWPLTSAGCSPARGRS